MSSETDLNVTSRVEMTSDADVVTSWSAVRWWAEEGSTESGDGVEG